MASDKDQERSPSGTPILRHTQELGAGGPTKFSEDDEAIQAHVEKHLGPIANVFHEIVSDAVHIDVLHVPATDTRPVHTLISMGMSALPMTVPSGVEAPRYLELMMTLPRTWQFGEEVKNDERWYWPIRELKTLARLPHLYKTWLGWGHTVPNEDPPKPFAPNTKLCGAIIVPSLLVPEDFYELKIAAHTITFFGIVPLYKEEMDLKLKQGAEVLFEKLIDSGTKDLVDISRRNVAKKRFGIF